MPRIIPASGCVSVPVVCHELPHRTWMKYSTPSSGEGGVFFRYPPYCLETPYTRATPHAPALPPPWTSHHHRNSDCPCPLVPATTGRQPPHLPKPPQKVHRTNTATPETVANRRFCFNAPLKTTLNPACPAFCPCRASVRSSAAVPSASPRFPALSRCLAAARPAAMPSVPALWPLPHRCPPAPPHPITPKELVRGNNSKREIMRAKLR